MKRETKLQPSRWAGLACCASCGGQGATYHEQFMNPSKIKKSQVLLLLTSLLALRALVLPAGAQSVYPTPYTFNTLAGLAGNYGSADGTGSAARFEYPWGVAVDSAGNVYVADSQNFTIRKVTPAGVVTTLAGLAGSFGSADGTGSAARFYYPTGVAVDSAGNVYVADFANDTIRKVTPAGVVTTLAGLAGSTGSTDGTGSAARFLGPRSVAVDSAGNVYVADEGNSTIRKVTPAGVVTTLAGLAGSPGSADGTGSAARFNQPPGVAVDSAGNVYVADVYNSTIRKVTPAGVVTTLAGLVGSPGSADGTGSTARFKDPNGVAADSAGNVYVADEANETIRKVTPAGVVTTLGGLVGSSGSADGTGSAARFNLPYGVAVDSAGNLYVADYNNYTIRKGYPRLPCVPAPTNLVLWLPFDERSGTTSANLASTLNPGTQVGGPGVVLGAYVDNSLSFSGVNQYVTVPDYPAIEIGTNNFTIDAWVNRATNGPDSLPSVIVDKRDVNTDVGYSLALSYGTLFLRMGSINYGDTGAHILPDGLWHFIAVSVSQSTGKVLFYIDGISNSTVVLTPANLNNTNSFWVGASPLGGNRPWTGDLDEVEVYNRALATNELYAIYSAGVAGKCKTNCYTHITVICPTNKTVQCGTTWNFDSPSASSCCGSNVTITTNGTVTIGTCPQFITRTWLLTDACGNSNTCSQTVTNVDTTPPVITCPTNTVVVALNRNCQLVIPYISVSATDNCTPLCSLIYSQSPTSGTIVAGHSQVVTVTVTDACGNSSHCLVTVIGVDKTGPVLSGPATLSVTNCLVPCVTNFFTVSDNCCPPSSLKITQSPPCNSLLGPGIHSVTITATDCNGNTTTKVIPLNISGNESFLGVLYSTGVDATRAPLVPNGATDLHYTLGPVPAGTTGYITPNAVVITNLWGWLESTPHISEWIAPTLPDIYSCPSGYYTYTNQFVLPSTANASTASISGRWAADDGASMYFNGVLQGANTIPVLPPLQQASGFNQWHPFTISSGFVGSLGKNTILFVVTNAAAYNPSPTGLRVEYTKALANCYTCAPPAIVSMTGNQSLPQFSTAAFHVNVSGTPPLTYQWYHNGVPLSNNGHDYNVTTPTLLVHPLNFGDAGIYSVVVSGPCGSVTDRTLLRVVFGWPWNWGMWNVAQLDNPLAASVGPDLNLVGSSVATNYAITAGTTEDFGLPEQGGQIVNVMHISPQAAASIQVPLIAPPGSNSVNSYTVIMDLYEPDTSFGTPSTLFESVDCCIGSSGNDGVTMTLDATNNLHIAGSTAGVPYDYASATPMTVDAWHRVALVVDGPQAAGTGGNLTAYLDGQTAVLAFPCPCCIYYAGPSINWSTSPPTLLSVQTNAVAVNGEFYVSSIQFHAVALTPQQLAGIGSPDIGPAPANDTSVGPQPVLSATVSNGSVSFSWTGSSYVLQETTSVVSGQWIDSALPFTESQVGGSIVTTAVANPVTEGPSKFYRLIFRP